SKCMIELADGSRSSLSEGLDLNIIVPFAAMGKELNFREFFFILPPRHGSDSMIVGYRTALEKGFLDILVSSYMGENIIESFDVNMEERELTVDKLIPEESTVVYKDFSIARDLQGPVQDIIDVYLDDMISIEHLSVEPFDIRLKEDHLLKRKPRD
ncbi:hypothetical protein ADUPG1_005600, partial [Aduncisulcus paluster]